VRIGLQARPSTPWGARGPVRVGFWLTVQTPAPAASPRNVRPPDLAEAALVELRPRPVARPEPGRSGGSAVVSVSLAGVGLGTMRDRSLLAAASTPA
jgi:hypothetical protein